TQITVTVFEASSGIPLTGYPFQAATSRGIISGDFITNSSGQAYIQLRSSYIPGPAEVTIILGTGLNFSSSIPFVSSHPTSISLDAGSTSLLADGVTSTTLTALVKDTLGNPVTGAEVAFQATMGTLSSENATTDENGEAIVMLNSPPSTTDTLGYVICQVTGAQNLLPSVPQQVTKITAKSRTARIHQRREVLQKLSSSIESVAVSDAKVRSPLTKSSQITLRDSVLINYRGVTISVSAEDPSLPADGSTSTTVNATVFETTAHSPVASTDVYFTTTNGTITGTVATDPNGVAAATLIAGNVAGSATIVSSFGMVLRDTISVDFYGLEPSQVSLSTATNTLLADGRDTTQLSALVTNIQGDPVPGTQIVFHASDGVLSESNVLTDYTGTGNTFLISPAQNSDATIVVNVSLPDFSTIVDTITLSLRGVSVTATVTDQALIADGQSTTTVNVLVRETSTNVAVPDEPVAFATTLGTITSPTSTDVNGQATALLTSSTITGLDTIFITVGQALHDTVTLSFLSPDPQSLVLTADTTSILGDGVSSLTITATVTDTLGGPVSGTQVVFNTTLGNLAQSTTTTSSDGITMNTLVSIARFTDTTVVITAMVAGFPAVQDSVSIIFRGITFTMGAQDSVLLADGSSTTQISAQLKETSNGHPLTSRTVFWSTSLGTIPGSTTTDNNGNTNVTLTSGTTAGTALIQGNFGNTLTVSTTVLFLAPSDSSIVLSWFNPPGTGDGNGDGTDDLQVTALFTDQSGLPIVGADIQFSLNPNTMGTIISPATTDGFGTATTTLRYSSQYIGNTVRVTAVNGSALGYIDIVLPALN
ncbi:MAG: Ig-like domain-containing protein, partial [Fidelibacterota bacterium]